MKGFQISSGVILLMTAGFLTQHIVMVSSAAITMGETCELMSEGFIASPASCQEYGYCKGGKLIGTGKCPNGYLYNPRTGVCDAPSNVECSVNDINTACQYFADQTFIADPNDCTRYCYCSNQKSECTVCPNTQIFDSKLTRCVYPSSGAKCMSTSVCRLVPNGVFLAAETCGNKYIGCLNGLENPGQCPGNSFYNKELGACQNENPCNGNSTGNSPGDVGLGVAQPPPQIKNVCANPLTSAASQDNPVFLTDQQTCMGYYVCTSNDGDGTWTKCPLGLHFNGGKCVTPYTFPCEFDRCGNMNQTFVGAIDTECKNFLICKDQTSQGKNSGYVGYEGLQCQEGTFFNEFTMSCSEKNPTAVKPPATETDYKLC